MTVHIYSVFKPKFNNTYKGFRYEDSEYIEFHDETGFIPIKLNEIDVGHIKKIQSVAEYVFKRSMDILLGEKKYYKKRKLA